MGIIPWFKHLTNGKTGTQHTGWLIKANKKLADNLPNGRKLSFWIGVEFIVISLLLTYLFWSVIT
jgi:hypothetical protein